MTLRPRSHQLEDQSRTKLRQLFESAGWTVDEIHKDYGEDLIVRIFEGGRATSDYFLVQVKATDDIRRFVNVQGVAEIPVRTSTAVAWNGMVQPVLLILWDARADLLYWSHVQNYFHTVSGSSRLAAAKDTVKIPVGSRLTADDLPALMGIVRHLTAWAVTSQRSLKTLQDEHRDKSLALYGTVALTISTREPAGDSIVFIDEIESSLHPAMVAHVVEALQKGRPTIGLRLRDPVGRVLHSSVHEPKILVDEIMQNSVEARIDATARQDRQRSRTRKSSVPPRRGRR